MSAVMTDEELLAAIAGDPATQAPSGNTLTADQGQPNVTRINFGSLKSKPKATGITEYWTKPFGFELDNRYADTNDGVQRVIGNCVTAWEILDDIEPQLHGPFPSPEGRDEQAVELRRQDPRKCNGLFRLDLSATAEPEASPYCGAELE
jgi:hypothetical protein